MMPEAAASDIQSQILNLKKRLSDDDYIALNDKITNGETLNKEELRLTLQQVTLQKELQNLQNQLLKEKEELQAESKKREEELQAESKKREEELQGEIKKREEELLAESRKRADLEAESDLRRSKLLKYGFPSLGRHMIASENPSFSEVYLPAKVIESKFDLITDNNLIVPYESVIWGIGQYTWATESDIQGLVKLALIDLINNSSLKGKISCLNELALFNNRPDIWIVCNDFGQALAVIEVKKPGKIQSCFDCNGTGHIYGQLFDYLCILRNLFGVQNVFGILTDYDNWRIFWLKDVQLIAESSSLDFPVVELNPEVSVDRTMNCTKVMKYNDPSTVKYLISFLFKSCHDQKHLNRTLHEKLCRPKLTESNCKWEYSNFDVFSFSLPRQNTKEFVLLKDFHGGADGRVWLATSKKGNLVVLKFFETNEMMKKEETLWKTLWCKSVYSVVLCKRPVLVMPFVFNCQKVENTVQFMKLEGLNVEIPNFPNPFEVAKIAIGCMLQKGFEHADIAWRHVAVMVNAKNQFVPILIDLSHVKKFNGKQKEKTDELMSKLLQEEK